jgi:hypothetical protein
MKLEFSEQICEKLSNIKFHENPATSNGFVPRGQMDGQPGMTKLIVTFCSFPNAPKNLSTTGLGDK